MGWANLIAQVRGRGKGGMTANVRFLSSLVPYNATVLKVVSLYPSYRPAKATNQSYQQGHQTLLIIATVRSDYDTRLLDCEWSLILAMAIVGRAKYTRARAKFRVFCRGRRPNQLSRIEIESE